MMFFKRDRCRTIWLRRVTCRRSACVGSSGIQTSGRKPLALKLGEHAGVDRIGLDLRMSDDAHLLWIRDHNFL